MQPDTCATTVAISAIAERVRIGILYNPLSGRNRRAPEALPRTVSGCSHVLMREVRTPGEVHDALTDFARQGLGLIVISGGDGTVQAALTVLFTRSPFATCPPLVVLAAGTTNMIAGDVGQGGDQHRALHRLVDWAGTGRGRVVRMQRPVLRLQVPGHETKCGMFCGAAIISQGVRYYQQNLHNQGLQGVVGIGLTLLRSLWAAVRHSNRRMTTTPMTVGLDGQPPRAGKFSPVPGHDTGPAVFRPAAILGRWTGAVALYGSQNPGAVSAAGPAAAGQRTTMPPRNAGKRLFLRQCQ